MTDFDESPIYLARKSLGLSRQALAERVDTSQQQIARLERGERRLTLEWAQRLAAALQVPATAILGISPTPPGFYAAESAIDLVPLIGQVSCGNWEEAVEQPIGLVPSMDGGPMTFALRAEGDSMDKLVPDHGIVGVDPDQRDLLDGKTYIVMNGDGETTAKRYRANPARLVPASSNGSHREIAIGREGFTVIGRVVWVLHSA